MSETPSAFGGERTHLGHGGAEGRSTGASDPVRPAAIGALGRGDEATLFETSDGAVEGTWSKYHTREGFDVL
jgi:hypothetical protein